MGLFHQRLVEVEHDGGDAVADGNFRGEVAGISCSMLRPGAWAGIVCGAFVCKLITRSDPDHRHQQTPPRQLIHSIAEHPSHPCTMK